MFSKKVKYSKFNIYIMMFSQTTQLIHIICQFTNKYVRFISYILQIKNSVPKRHAIPLSSDKTKNKTDFDYSQVSGPWKLLKKV